MRNGPVLVLAVLVAALIACAVVPFALARGKLLVVASNSTDQVATYSVDRRTGRLTPIGSVDLPAGPRHRRRGHRRALRAGR